MSKKEKSGIKYYVSETVAEYNECPYCFNSTERYVYNQTSRVAEIGEEETCEHCGETYTVEGEDFVDE